MCTGFACATSKLLPLSLDSRDLQCWAQTTISSAWKSTRARGASAARTIFTRSNRSSSRAKLIPNDLSSHHREITFIHVNYLSFLWTNILPKWNCVLFAWIKFHSREPKYYINNSASPPRHSYSQLYFHSTQLWFFNKPCSSKTYCSFYAAKPLQIGDKEKKQTYDSQRYRDILYGFIFIQVKLQATLGSSLFP